MWRYWLSIDSVRMGRWQGRFEQKLSVSCSHLGPQSPRGGRLTCLLLQTVVEKSTSSQRTLPRRRPPRQQAPDSPQSVLWAAQHLGRGLVCRLLVIGVCERTLHSSTGLQSPAGTLPAHVFVTAALLLWRAPSGPAKASRALRSQKIPHRCDQRLGPGKVVAAAVPHQRAA